MGADLLTMVFKIIAFLPFIVFLIYIVLKYGGGNLQKLQNGKYLKIIERVPLSKDSSLVVVKMGGRAYVVSSTAHRVEILRELEEEETFELSESKVVPEFKSFRELMDNFRRKGR